jgi:hypothetical protein
MCAGLFGAIHWILSRDNKQGSETFGQGRQHQQSKNPDADSGKIGSSQGVRRP